MTQEIINIGTSPNAGDGDPLRVAFTKSNDNFTELYGFSADLSGVTDAAQGRTNLGLGSLAIQNSNTVIIGGGTIDGVVIGASSPASATVSTLFANNTTVSGDLTVDVGQITSAAGNALKFAIDGTEVARVNSSGELIVGATAMASAAKVGVVAPTSGLTTDALLVSNPTASAAGTAVAIVLDPNGSGTGTANADRAASIRSTQTTSGNFADLRFYVAPGDSPTESLRLSPNRTFSFGSGADANYVGQIHAPNGIHSILQLTNAATGSGAADGFYIGVLDGNTDVRIWNQESAAIQLGVNGAEVARFTNTGDLAVGKTSAVAMLDVNGAANIGTNEGVTIENAQGAFGIANSAYVRRNSGNGDLEIYASGDVARNFIFGNNGAEIARFDTSGNLGVGTNSPDATVHGYSVAGTAQTIGKFEAAVGAYTGTSLVAANTLGDSSTFNLFSCINDSDGDAGGPYTKFLVRGDGNVFIGGDTAETGGGLPGIGLQIQSTDGQANTAMFRYSDNNAGPSLNLGKSRSGSVGGRSIVQNNDVLGSVYFYGDGGSNLDLGASIYTYVNGTPGDASMPTAMVLATSPAGAAAPIGRVYIYNSGQVAIGPGGGTEVLEVAGAVRLNGSAGNFAAGARGVSIDVAAEARVFQVNGSSGTALALAFGNGNTEKMRIDTSGQVIIGATTGTEMLDVNGDAIRVRSSQTPGSASATGNQGTIAWDDSFIYVCTATDTWKRAALATW